MLVRITCSMKNVLKCTALTVGATVGVGFVSGLEWQMFVGDNIPVFVAVFAIANCLFACVSSQYRADTPQKLCACLFGKYAALPVWLLTLSNALTVVALLSASSEVLHGILPQAAPLVYAVAVCLVAALLTRINSNKCAVVSAVVSACAIGCMLLPLTTNGTSEPSSDVKPILTIAYALFDVTMLSGVTTRTACNNTVRQNIVYSLLSAMILGAMLYLPCKIGCLGELHNPLLALLPLLFVTYLLSASTSVYANAAAPLVALDELTKDRSLSAYLLFTFATALSLFGVQHIMKFAYIAVACVGLMLFGAMLVKILYKQSKQAQMPILTTK